MANGKFQGKLVETCRSTRRKKSAAEIGPQILKDLRGSRVLEASEYSAQRVGRYHPPYERLDDRCPMECPDEGDDCEPLRCGVVGSRVRPARYGYDSSVEVCNLIGTAT